SSSKPQDSSMSQSLDKSLVRSSSSKGGTLVASTGITEESLSGVSLKTNLPSLKSKSSIVPKPFNSRVFDPLAMTFPRNNSPHPPSKNRYVLSAKNSIKA